MAQRGAERSTEEGDETNRVRDIHREVERRVQGYTQRWHREEMRKVQKGEMRRAETEIYAEMAQRRAETSTERGR